MKRRLKDSTLIKKIEKRFPDFKLMSDEHGLYYIIDRFGENIFDEFMFPKCNSEREALEQGYQTACIIQNINRTHPLRDSNTFGGSEMKTLRIRRRKRKKS